MPVRMTGGLRVQRLIWGPSYPSLGALRIIVAATFGGASP